MRIFEYRNNGIFFMFSGSVLAIDLDRIAANYKAIKNFVRVKTIAVVKADAYGLGAVRVAKRLQGSGCHSFAVASADEGVKLRENGIKGDVLVLGYTPESDIKTLCYYDLTQSILSEEHAQGFFGKGVKVQLAVDFGMKRAGIDPSDENAVSTIEMLMEKCRLTGLYGHLCAADEEKHDGFTQNAIRSFSKIYERYFKSGMDLHLLNSAAAMRFPIVGNAVRVGILLYGIKPFEGVMPIDLKPAVEFTSVISSVRRVKTGESVGYGRSFFAERDMTIATVACGYADGFSRDLSNVGEVLIKGQKAKVVGRVCMDCFCVDVTDISGAREGEIVTIFGNGLSVEEHAKSLSSISHEVLSRIGARVKRKYIKVGL